MFCRAPHVGPGFRWTHGAVNVSGVMGIDVAVPAGVQNNSSTDAALKHCPWWVWVRMLVALFAITGLSAADRYWVGLGGDSNWSTAANWASTSGGSEVVAIPGSTDVVYFDGVGASANGDCSVDVAAQANALIMSVGYSGALTCGINTLSIAGSADFRSGGTFSGSTGGVVITATGTLTPPGAGTLPNVTISGGVVTLAVNTLTVAGNMTLTGGTLVANSLDITVAGSWLNAVGTSGFTAGTGTVFLASTWSPALVAGLAAWYDATDASTITSAGGSVSQWNDGSGNGRDLKQSNASLRPETGVATIGGLNVISSRNVMRFLDVDTAFSAVQIFAVVGFGASPTNYDIAFLGAHKATSPNYEAFIRKNAGGGDTISWDGTNTATGKSSIDGAPYSATSRGQTTVIPSECVFSGVWGVSHSIGRFCGRSGVNAPSAAGSMIGELLWLSTEVSTAERERLEGYLAWKWGLQASLPGAHPYASQSPVPLTIAIQGSTDFFSLTITSAQTRTVIFEAGSTQTVNGAFTVQGSSGRPQILQSSASPATWTVVPNGSRNCAYLEVQDAINATATPINPFYATDHGNTTLWFGADRYWVAAGSSGWSDSGMWAYASGGPAGAPSPGVSNLVTYDANGLGDCALDGAITVAGLTVSSAYTGDFDFFLYPLTVTGNADLRTGGTFSGSSGGLVFAGGTHAVQTSSATAIPNLSILSGAVTLTADDLAIAGNLLISAGSLTTNNFAVNVGGNWTNTSGASGFSAGSGTVTLAGTARWDPGQLANVAAWYDAADSASVVESAGQVSRWNDKSSHGNHATQANPALRPLYLDHHVITNAGGMDIPGVAATSIFAVVRNVNGSDVDTGISPVAGCDNVGGEFTYTFLYVNDPSAYSISVDGSSYDFGDASMNGGPLTPGDGTGTNIDLGANPFVNHAADDVVYGQINAQRVYTRLMYFQNATLPYYSKAEFAEIIFLSATPSQAERERLEGYLAWKWGAQGSLPGAHPYALVAPVADVTMVSGDTIFNNLSATFSVTHSIVFAADSSQDIDGTLTMQGASGELLTLRSTVPGGAWAISPRGTRQCAWLTVQDGTNRISPVIAPASSTDSGGNVGWFSQVIGLSWGPGTAGAADGSTAPVTWALGSLGPLDNRISGVGPDAAVAFVIRNTSDLAVQMTATAGSTGWSVAEHAGYEQCWLGVGFGGPFVSLDPTTSPAGVPLGAVVPVHGLRAFDLHLIAPAATATAGDPAEVTVTITASAP